MKRIARIMAMFSLLLMASNAVQASDERSSYRLLVAAFQGKASEVEQLLDKGVSPDFSCHGLTPLIVCSLRGHQKVAELLVARGAQVNLRSGTGPTALMTASANNHLGLVQFLLEHGGDPNIKASFVWGKLALTGDQCRDLDQLGVMNELCAREPCCMTALCVATDKKVRDVLVQHGARE